MTPMLIVDELHCICKRATLTHSGSWWCVVLAAAAQLSCTIQAQLATGCLPQMQCLTGCPP